jgi:hypothetical protein
MVRGGRGEDIGILTCCVYVCVCGHAYTVGTLWGHAFILAVGDLIIAGAAAEWFLAGAAPLRVCLV